MESADAETVWVQVEMQNAALMLLLNWRTRKLAWAAQDENLRKVFQLFDMSEIYLKEEEVDDDDYDKDEEARNICERMERSMKGTGEDSESDDAPTNTDNTPPGKTEENLATLELNDGSFNITDMEDFVNEQEYTHGQ